MAKNSGTKDQKLDKKTPSVIWQKDLDDQTLIKDVYMPATHDSGAMHSFLGVSGKCQSYNIADQLSMGMRFLDIRIKLVENKLCVFHGIADQKLSFNEVISDVKEFIEENPSEFIFLMIKEEDAPVDSTVAFEEAVETVLTGQLGDLLSQNRSIPETVKDARGMIHLISRYSNNSMGIDATNGWADSTTFEHFGAFIQDCYKVSDENFKIEKMKIAFDAYNEGKYSMILNYSSCYFVDAFPPAHAPTAAKKINPILTDMLLNNKCTPCVYLCDFITPELAKLIIDQNFK
jgi:1-phosphatidylinositol phosphodiesterase